MPALTGLRGLAAVWVLLFHTWGFAIPRAITIDLPFDLTLKVHPIFSLGWAGVQVFFVLSAFLLTLPYAEYHRGLRTAPPRSGSYLVRRIARVFPAYYLQLMIMSALAAAALIHTDFKLQQLPSLLLMNFLPEPLGESSALAINGVWWTLPVEFSFYLVLPVLARFATTKKIGPFLLSAIGVTIAFRFAVIALPAYFPGNKVLWFSQLPGSMDSFAFGMATAVLFSYFKSASPDRQKTFLLLGQWAANAALPVVILLLFWMDTAFMDYRKASLISFLWTPILNLAIATLIFSTAIKPRNKATALAAKPLFFLGSVSYGIYLWHFPVANEFIRHGIFDPKTGYIFVPLTVATLAVSILLGYLSWRFVEQPLIQYVHNHTRPAIGS